MLKSTPHDVIPGRPIQDSAVFLEIHSLGIISIHTLRADHSPLAGDRIYLYQLIVQDISTVNLAVRIDDDIDDFRAVRDRTYNRCFASNGVNRL